ncbi:hypothetical protein D3C80_1296910 [compost metagenome]
MTQWWLVRIRPSPETKEAEQPCRRTAALRTRSSHDWSMRVPYLSFTVWIGKLSNVHMPSSARAGVAVAPVTAAATPRAASEAVKEKVRRSDIQALSRAQGTAPRVCYCVTSAVDGRASSPLSAARRRGEAAALPRFNLAPAQRAVR